MFQVIRPSISRCGGHRRLLRRQSTASVPTARTFPPVRAPRSDGPVSNANSVSIDNGIGNVGSSGSRQVTPTFQTQTYRLTATGAGGTRDRTVSINVSGSMQCSAPAPNVTAICNNGQFSSSQSRQGPAAKTKGSGVGSVRDHFATRSVQTRLDATLFRWLTDAASRPSRSNRALASRPTRACPRIFSATRRFLLFS